MAHLVVVTGPIAVGKNTVADALALMMTARGHSAVVADVDDVAAMVAEPGAAESGLWFAAHAVHGTIVGQWMRSAVDYVVAVGPIYSTAEQDALVRHLPQDVSSLWVVIDAPVAVTLARARADHGRGRSREVEFHNAAHRRFRELLPGIRADIVLDSSALSTQQMVTSIAERLCVR